MQVLYKATDYNTAQAANNTLALAIDDKSCAFAIHNNNQLSYLGYHAFESSLQENEVLFFDFVRSTEELKINYSKTAVILASAKCTLVPQEYFNDLYIDSYLKHLYTIDSGEIIKTASALNNQAQIVFAAKSYIFYPAQAKYHTATIEPRAALYLRKSLQQHPNALSAFFDNGNLFLIHNQNEKTIFFNCFEYKTVEEAAYFILNYFQAFNIPIQNLPILLYGQIHAQLKEILTSYEGNCQTMPVPENAVELPLNFNYQFLIDFIF